MRFLADAWESLRLNRESLLLYVGALFLLNVALDLLALLLFGPAPRIPAPPGYLWYALALGITYAMLLGGVQAIVFARFGEEIDKPLWRCPTDKDALRHFFMLWFLINLLLIAVLHFQGVAYRLERQELYAVLDGLFLVLFLFALPVGTCIMYLGRFHWNELGVALRPLGRQPDLALVVFLLRFVQYILFLMAQRFYAEAIMAGGDDASWQLVRNQVLLLPIALLPFWVLDCYLFAATWRICMINRDQDVEEMEDPFDF